MNDSRHGKAMARWCDRCGTLLLGEGCDRCGSAGRAFDIAQPGDIRPAFGRGEELVRGLFHRDFGASSFLDGRLVFLNKVPGEDRADEIVLGGRIIGVLRYDLKRDRFDLDLTTDGALLLLAAATRGILSLNVTGGHLKGKNLDAGLVVKVEGGFEPDSPIIALAGSLVCVGTARAASSALKAGEKSVHIRDVTKRMEPRPVARSTWSDFVTANRSHLLKLESKGVSDVKSFVGNSKLPTTLSFSGGKDSLVAYGIAKKAVKDLTLIFVNTGLEFPQTVSFVRGFASKNGERLLEADAGDAFWQQVDTFGPPAKDFRWCCKVCKLAPLTDLIERTYPEGVVTIEGNRQRESFARAEIGFVERNPFVPNQTVLNPLREWRAAEVWAYIWWKGFDYNPLYEQDFERIGCYLCPACLASEWRTTAEVEGDAYRRWNEYLVRWAAATGAGKDFVAFGFWRWKVLPPKMRRLAEEVGLKAPRLRSDRLQLRMVKGISPCLTGGYSVEGVISAPTKRPFAEVAEVLKTVGEVRHSEELEIALVKAGDATLKVFGGGQVVATAKTRERAGTVFEAGVKAFLRAQMCTMCGICVKNCKQRAASLRNGPAIDADACTRCGKCAEACVVAHYYDKLVTGPVEVDAKG